jgi:hypothetical protein
MKVLLSTAYLPNIQYMFYVINSENVSIERHENYIKQSYRNRTRILTANGVLDLVIPVKKTDNLNISNIEISYQENWQIKHLRAITSASKNSPYFDFFEQEINELYTIKPEKLFDYNLLQLNTILKILRIKKNIQLTNEFVKESIDQIDMRYLIHPKLDYASDLQSNETINKPYYQTFGDKLPFCPNLSILDLIFNQGIETGNYFKV